MDLVIMAGGMGSRFGGLKQIAPIDEDKNFILDYSIYDAIRSGFDRVVFIIKKETLDDFKNTIGKRLEGIIPVEYVLQGLNDVPKGFEVPLGRVKPWGTAHAIYCCKDVVDDKFAVINADDFYGFESFKLIADFLRNSKSHNEFISAGFQVKNTLSDKGTVKRGVFVMENGKATGLIESEVELRDGKVFATPLNQNRWREIDENTMVSMTMFGFTKKIIKKISEDFDYFFAQPKENLVKGEFLLPEEVNKAIKEEHVDLFVKETGAKWYGMTYKEDYDDFVLAIKKMKEEGKYPKHLYSEKNKSYLI